MWWWRIERGPLLIYKNTVTPENQWIEFELEGTASNRSAIGAQVTLFWNGQQQMQEVSGGSGFARRISGGCISAWANFRKSKKR